MPALRNEEQELPLDLKSGTYHDPVYGSSQTIPLLDSKWIEYSEVEFISYIPPPVKVDLIKQTYSEPNKTELQEWEERASFIYNDLKWLLCQSHSQFWNQIIFNKSINMCLDSFLKLTPRSFDVWKFLPEKILNLQKQLHRSVFMVYLRMSTHKESKKDFLSPTTFGEILYENFLFDIPKIMDLCAVYGGEESGNTSLLTKMLDNVFSKQPKYIDDLLETIPSIFQTFETIEEELGVTAHNDVIPQKLTKNAESGLRISNLNDILLHLFDTFQTLHSLLHSLPTLCQHFFKFGLIQRLAGFYEETMPLLEKKYHGAEFKMARRFLKRCKLGVIKICRLIFNVCCLEPLVNSDIEVNVETKEDCVERFLCVIMEVLSFKRFLHIYHAFQSIEVDIGIIYSSGLAVDETRIQYVISAVNGLQPDFKPDKVNGVTTDELTNTLPSNQITKSTKKRNVSDVEANSMISHVKDLLPDCGGGFIIMCLREFNYDVEKTINLILENSLPPQLQKLDRKLEKIDVDVSSGVLSTRQSVYDNDQFDIFSRDDVDLSRIHKGKPRYNDNVRTVLDDKKDIQTVKQVVLNYDETFDDYEDEYDDTYDTHDVGAQDIDSADELTELTTRRAFTTPIVLRNMDADSSDEEEKNLDSQDNLSTGNTKEIHQTKEYPEREFSERNQGNQRRGFHGKSETLRGKRDYGNERDRSYKDKHKARIANHNRKAAAAKKQSRGMIS